MGAEPLVVALGGNTLLGERGPWTAAAQRAAIEETARAVAEPVRAGRSVVLTHGNGPQVGNLLIQQEAAPETPQLPLDVLVAETQAQIGYLLQQALDNELGGGTDFMTVVTQTLVDPDDPAFDAPSKPIGPWYDAETAAAKPFVTRAVGSGERPHRRIVASPEPVAVVEAEEISRLVEREQLVVCGGGGGVPVVRDRGLRGVEAVVDKDRTSQVLATAIDAAELVVLTDVDHAYLGFGSADPEPIGRTTPVELRTHLEAGEFPPGSMRPKVEACVRFVEAGGERAVIATPDRFDAALDDRAGTRVYPDT